MVQQGHPRHWTTEVSIVGRDGTESPRRVRMVEILRLLGQRSILGGIKPGPRRSWNKIIYTTTTQSLWMGALGQRRSEVGKINYNCTDRRREPLKRDCCSASVLVLVFPCGNIRFWGCCKVTALERITVKDVATVRLHVER